jgi:hypothetical protein
MKTTAPLTKDQEKKLYCDLIAKCPDGYVKDILTDMRADVERAITSDLGFITLGLYLTQAEEQRQELLTVSNEVKRLRSEIRDLEGRKQLIEQGLYTVRKTVRELTGL